MPDILVLNGPNLNLLGQREPQLYGPQSLDDIIVSLMAQTKAHGLRLDALQSNAEHELIERIHLAFEENVQFIIFNPAAFTHTSIALRDALLGVAIPFIEVHLSNIHQRESFRKKSYFSDIAEGVIAGLGPKGYQLALETAIERLQNQST